MLEPLEPKASGAVKDYGIDWTNYLAPDVTISDAEWEIVSGLEGSPDLAIVTDSIVDTRGDAVPEPGLFTLVRLSGGEEGQDYVLVCAATTSAGEELPEAIKVRVKSAAEAAAL